MSSLLTALPPRTAVLTTPTAGDLLGRALAQGRTYGRRSTSTGRALSEDADAEEARGDFHAFCRRMYRDYLGGWHIDRLRAALVHAVETPGSRLIVTMPPRHSKSLHTSILLPAWYLGRHPDRRVIAASHTDVFAKRWGSRVRNTLRHPSYPFDEIAISADSSAANRWAIAHRLGGYDGVGVKGSPAGLGADLLLLDDPIGNSFQADSAVFRETLWDWYREDIRTRLEPGASIILTATRWHHADLTGRLLDAQASGGEPWTHLHFPAIDADGDQLWPEYWSLAELEATRATVGPRAWEALYQGRPSVTSGSVLKRHWWRYWHHPGQDRDGEIVEDERGHLVLAPCVPLPASFDDMAQSWDMSFRKTEHGSFVVGQMWGRTGADRFLLDQFRKRVDFPDTLLAVRAMTTAYPMIGTKLVENKANGPAVVAQLRGVIPGLVEVEPVGGKEARANAAAAVASSGNVYLPHPSIAPWVESFVDECADFPFGAADDQVDAFSQAQHHFGLGLSAFGFSYLSPNGHTPGADGRLPGTAAIDAVGNDVPDFTAHGRAFAWR